MAYTETSSQGWFSRLWESITGVLVGIILFLIAFPILFWGEGRAVHRSQSLAEGKSQVVSVSADKVDPANQGKLVHMSGKATSAGTLDDSTFGVEAPNALQLRRLVEMYQWEEDEKTEKKKKLGGGEETVKTYTYDKVWSDKLLDSGDYKEANHTNPAGKPYDSQDWVAPDATVGAFKLGTKLTEQVDTWAKVSVESTKVKGKMVDSVLYTGADPNAPKIGDARVTFQSVQPADVSLIAVQTGDSFSPFATKADASGIFRLEMGTVSADQMFQTMESENSIMTWALRLVGFIFMVVGISLVFRPLVVVADVVPFVGNLLGAGLGFVAFALAIPFTLVTIAIGWIVYRPLVGIALLVVAGAVTFFAFKMASKKKAAV